MSSKNILTEHPLYFLSLDSANTEDHLSGISNAMAEAEIIDSGEEDNTHFTYKLKNYNAEVSVNCSQDLDSEVIESITSIINTGARPITLNTLSSGYVTGIGKDAPGPWAKGRFKIHICHTSWQGEGQWQQGDPEDFGLYQTYNHNTQRAFRIGGIGSWTTCRYYPLLILEDTLLDQTWYFEVASSASWYIEISVGGYRENTWFNVYTGGCCCLHDGWHYKLNPGESYTAPLAFYGRTKGGFEEAIRQLVKYKRSHMLRKFPENLPPVCFNDYMNCLWALPTREKLIPLINAAAYVGCQYFIIDAGWFKPDGNMWVGLGDYFQNDDLFGQGGFDGIIEYIKEKGMLPGCWIEGESVSICAEILKEIPNGILTRYGDPIGKNSCFFDFRQPLVRQHLMSIFDRLYNKGIRYIKNDYNHNAGIGIDGELGEASCEELKRNQKAFLSLMDEVHEKYPDLIVENCSSGCMRADHESEKHFFLQSVSDQEFYQRMPSIVQGLSACMPPERMGIWSYPYPVSIDFRSTFTPSQEFTDRFKDGCNTIFNMVQAMPGCLYLSGHIDCADKENLELIKEAVEVYKKNLPILVNSAPVYPTGINKMSQEGIMSLGMKALDNTALLLSVWKTGEEQEASIDLSKYCTADSFIETVYPGREQKNCHLENACLNITFPQSDSAVYLKIKI